MKAVIWNGVRDVRVERVKDPEILNPRDAILRVTATAICGSDLHLSTSLSPAMRAGDILGHEFMGIVEEVGAAVRDLRPGDRVVVPFNIACGSCEPCRRERWALCDCAGVFGYSQMLGGYSGGQAEFVRVPFADVGPLKVPDSLEDEEVLFLSDIFPAGYMAAENCDIQSGDVVAVWGCGPVGQFAIRSAILLGAEEVIAIDHMPERLDMARMGGATVVNFDEVDVLEALYEMTGGRGPDACIDCAGTESHGITPDALAGKAKQTMRMQFDRAQVLRMAAQAAGKGGTLSIPGVYGGFIDKIPMGTISEKGLQIRTGQTHTHRYMRPLLTLIRERRIDPSFAITHRGSLDDAPEYYGLMAGHDDDFVKAVLVPGVEAFRSTSGVESEELAFRRR